MTQEWLVIGISGVTCGGKTTLSMELNKLLPQCQVISQDDYFLPVDDPRHTWIPELNHINFDIVSSLDIDKLYHDLLQILKQRNSRSTFTNGKYDILTDLGDNFEINKLIQQRAKKHNINFLIIEGFCIFNDKKIADLCDIKYYFTLPMKDCNERRIKRVYEPPDCPGYFEKCAWPEYLNLLEEVKNTVNDVTYFDGRRKQPLGRVLKDILEQI